MKPVSVLLLIILISLYSPAQEKSPIKFGKISPEDFKTTVYSIDSNASAVVLGDIGFSYFEANESGGFRFIHNRYKRVHILNKNGYDAANVEIYLYTQGNREEDLQSLKAVTYNLENGKVIESKLENKSVFKDRLDKNSIKKKFTLPNVKEGSIIEFSYTIRSDFFRNARRWLFQGDYPVLWSDLEFQIPEFFNYVFITEGYQPFYKKQPPGTTQGNFDITLESLEAGAAMKRERFKLPAMLSNHRWVMKNVPALKLENYTSSLSNHIAKIEFQLSEIRHPLTYHPVMQTWQMMTKDLLQSEYFGLQLDKGNAWMDDDLENVTAGIKTDFDKAKRIYEYVRDNFTCTDHNAFFMDQLLKNILKTKKGNVAEINLLLVGLLKSAGLKAEPVLLSTRDHGYTYSMYPLINKFNYVIAALEIDGKIIYLDATRPKMGFGRILPDCYNGHARMVNTAATPLNFTTDSLAERKITSIFIIQDEKGKMNAALQQTPGIYEAYHIREEVGEKGQEEFFKNIKKGYSLEIEMQNMGIDSLKKPDEPLVLHYDFSFTPDKEDVIYFNPMMGEGQKENPFKTAVRLYPVEMPYTFDETFVFRMDVPAGYAVDELPKSIRVNFDEQGSSYFEYIIGENDGTISLRSRIKMTRSYFVSDEYDILREFYSLIVKKHGEQIVFQKKK